MSAVHTRPHPNLFIIGFPKCGTTSLYEYLRGHPQVFMSPSKEPGYFGADDPQRVHRMRYGVDEERYLDLFAEAGEARRRGEATVGYVYSERAPRRIREFDPEARIIAMVRNPVDMIHSLHNQRMSEGREEIADFAEAMKAEMALAEGAGARQSEGSARQPYRDRALFARHLPRWFESFGHDRVHVVVLEDLEREPAKVFRAVLEFLDVDAEYQPEQFRVYNVRHQPRSHLFRRLTKSAAPQFFVWNVLPRLLGDVGTRRLVRRFRHSRLNRRPAERSPMDAHLRRQLEDYYAADVEQLSQMLGRDLAALWWGRPALELAGAAALSRSSGST